MNKITLIGIDTAKQVFHTVGVDARGHCEWRKQVGRRRLLPTLSRVECCLEEMRVLHGRIDHDERRIDQRVQADEASRRLRAKLGGVGKPSASALRVKVADVRDFSNGRQFAACLGLAPGHSGTGGKVSIGHIKRGHDRYLRQLLIHGARSALHHPGDKQDAQSR
jgi:transposase